MLPDESVTGCQFTRVIRPETLAEGNAASGIPSATDGRYARRRLQGRGPIDRRRAIRFASAAFFAAWLLQSPASYADQAFQRFLPLFVDLNGWQGKKPDGMTMEMSNNSMTTATREYRRGAAKPDAAVFVGQAAGNFPRYRAFGYRDGVC